MKFHILKGNRVVAKADKLGEAEAYAKKVGGRVLQVAEGTRKNPTKAGKPTWSEQDVTDTTARFGKGTQALAKAFSHSEWTFKDRNAAKAFADWAQIEAGIPFFWDMERYRVTTDGNHPVMRQTLESAGQPESANKIRIRREAERAAARKNPAEDENEECHDPEFWAGEIIGEVVAAVQAEAKDVYFDPSDGTLQYNGKVATLASTGNGKVIVTTLSFDDDDEMTEHFDRFGPSKSEKDAYAIAKRITGFLLKRKNPSAGEHHELGESDLDEARHNLRLAKDDPRHYGIPALSSAAMAMREGVHAHDREMTAEAMRIHGEASGLLQSRKNGAAHPAETWARSERKPSIDFGELGNDKTALAKWLGEHPGKTATFKAAGTVYHSANIGGQVFTVPAARKNGDAPHWSDPRYGQAIDPNALAAIKKAIESSRKSDRPVSVTVDPQGRDFWTWRDIVADCAKGEQIKASMDGQMLRVFTPAWNIGITFAYKATK